jgi:hypothetical protein
MEELEPRLLDFEANPIFVLQVRVTDSGAPALSDTALVTIQLYDLVGVADPISRGGPAPDPGLGPDPGPGPKGSGAGDAGHEPQ